MRFRINALNIANFGTGIVLTLGVPLVYGKQLETLVGKFKANTEWELKPYKQKRSLSANNYFWVLADKIAEAIKKAFESKEKQYHPSTIDFLALKVTADFEPKIKDG